MRSLLALALLLVVAPAFGQDTTSNLEAHYTFNTNGNDSTVNARHLAALSPTHGTGHVGNALTRGRYQLADASFLNGDSTYTLALWVKSASRTEVEVLAVGPSTADAVILTAPALAEIDNTLSGSCVRRTRAATPGTPAWSFAALVVNAGAATHYSDASGDLVATSLSGDWTMPSTGTKIVVGPAQYPGAVDQFRIYSRALALADIEALAAE